MQETSSPRFLLDILFNPEDGGGVASKLALSNTGSQKTEVSIDTAVRISNPTEFDLYHDVEKNR